MKLIFAGTPEVAVASLRALAAGPHEVVAVITREDAPLGRKRILTPSPVARAAEQLGLPVIRTNRLDGEVTAQLEALAADLGVIVAYGGLVREPLLSMPRLGWINVHFSLLPAWRGAAPVQRALMNGDTESGATVFQLVAALDAGAILGVERTPIGPDETATELLARLSEESTPLLERTIEALASGTAVAHEQAGESSHAAKLSIVDARLDWRQSAASVYAHFRGVTSEPGACTVIGEQRFKILSARMAPDAAQLPPGTITAVDGDVLVGTGSHPLLLGRVQPAGKAGMAAKDWWRGVGRDTLHADEPEQRTAEEAPAS